MTHGWHDRSLSRRSFVGAGVGTTALALGFERTPLWAAAAQDEPAPLGDPARWNAEAIRERAGTLDVDTVAEVHQVVPGTTSGRVSYWYVGPTEASPEIERRLDEEFWAAFAQAYPNIEVDLQNVDYNGMLDKVRVAAEAGAAPMVARMPIMWGVEFAAKGQLAAVDLAEFGYAPDLFWPGALKSVTWEGTLYGIPTNNETMALIWNKQIFADAGLDPENPPATWEDLVAYSRQIKEETGKAGYGLVARVNAGNTPFRFMPAAWAYGGGALDEAEPNPTYDRILIDSEGTRAAVQAMHDMYVRDRSVPTAALTNTQVENRDPFVAGQLGMMIGAPGEFAIIADQVATATGADKAVAEEVAANTAFGLIPEGPVRRAVVFGGSNVHLFADEAHGGPVDRAAATALIAFMTSPEWATKLAWANSNPGNLRGFETVWMRERLEQTRFLEAATAMLPYGIPFPVIPESTEIMNIIVPEMLQNVLTETMTVEEATAEAASRIEGLLAAR